jgi:hypothetical protein
MKLAPAHVRRAGFGAVTVHRKATNHYCPPTAKLPTQTLSGSVGARSTAVRTRLDGCGPAAGASTAVFFFFIQLYERRSTDQHATHNSSRVRPHLD